MRVKSIAVFAATTLAVAGCALGAGQLESRVIESKPGSLGRQATLVDAGDRLLAVSADVESASLAVYEIPAQGLTVVQALSLAWGPTQNAAIGKAILIREQKGGRTLTTLNLKKMLHGQEPDQAVHDRDILFVPDSAAKNLLNHTMESAIQSAIGVTIYSGLVYSQRY